MSTPIRKGGSNQVGSDSHVPTTSCSQEVPITIMQYEIGNQTWQFGAEIISRMLSPKTPKSPERDLTLLDSYDCIVSQESFMAAFKQCTIPKSPEWPVNKRLEREHYQPLALFLNCCVKNATNTLQNLLPSKTWYPSLYFVPYDKAMKDGIDGAASVNPGLGGGNGLNKFEAGDSLYWSPPEEDQLQMQIPIGVKADDEDLVEQAATYGRCLFAVHPSRTFALVLGFNHMKRQLRFLIHHRGGLTSSFPLDINSSTGRKDTVRLIMTILLWNFKDAGLIDITNDIQFIIPKGEGNGYLVGSSQKVLYNSICVRGRATRVCRTLLADPHTSTSTINFNVPTQLPKVEAGRYRSSFTLDQSPEDNTSIQLPNAETKCRIDPYIPGQPSKNVLIQESGNRRSARIKAIIAKGLRAVTQTFPELEDAMDGTNIFDKMEEDEIVDQTPIVVQRAIHPVNYVNPIGMVLGDTDPIDGECVVQKQSWQPADRKNLEHEVYKAVGGLYGVTKVICSYQAAHPSGEPVSNAIFLPTEEQREKAHWPLYSNQCPKLPDLRYFCVTVFGLEGELLVEAPSSWDLLEAITHGMLGWLCMYQKGYLHRDISIGNVLLVAGTKGAKAEPFKFAEEFLQKLRNGADATGLVGAPSLEEKANSDALKCVYEIEKLIDELKISSTFKGFVTDADMAARWDDYFQNVHVFKDRSGTREFMSHGLHKAVLEGSDYLQSPVDDLHSFFWVALWAMLFNASNESQRSDLEKEMQEALEEVHPDKKLHLVYSLWMLVLASKKSPIASQLSEVLHDWCESLTKLNKDWIQRALCLTSPPDNDGEYYLPQFHKYTLRGVADFLKIVKEHAERVKAYGNFQDNDDNGG